MRKVVVTALALVFGGMAAVASAQEPQGKAQSLDQLLDLVRQGKVAETQEHRQREQEFLRNKAGQQQMIDRAVGDRTAQEKRSEQLEGVFQENERQLAALEQQLQDRLGSLKELFGVLQQVAGDARATFEQSIVSAQYPNREKNLTELIEKTAGGSRLPSIEEIEGLWFEVQREMTESGKVVSFPATVILPDGSREDREVVRVGTFNLTSNGEFVDWLPTTQTLATFVRQPAGRFQSAAANFQNAEAGTLAQFPIDPSRGAILSLLVQAPSLSERVDQGGIVGYVTLGLGVIGMLLVIERLIYLTMVNRKVQAQIRSNSISTDNPLGRVLTVYQQNKDVDVETLELKLDEAIMKEMPPLERFIGVIKIISAVAPLLGLLGTVTGMIQTFQAMTLFGTGDPKLMAGGISQALVTTVQGLVVALPTLFFWSIISGMSKRVVHTLEEQSAGIVAVHAEQESKERNMLELYQAFEQVRDFMERGGPILTWIAVATFVMWALIIERVIYYSGPSRREIEKAYAAWEARKERKSWYAHQIREAMVSQIRMNLNAGLPTIKTLTAICPLLGLLGTVTGMIMVFDVMALLGSGNVRAMASGVSRATIPTMSGMVAALSGVFAMTILQRRARAQTALLEDHLTMDH